MALTLTKEDIDVLKELIISGLDTRLDQKFDVIKEQNSISMNTMEEKLDAIKEQNRKTNLSMNTMEEKLDILEEQNRKTNLSMNTMEEKLDILEEQNRKTNLSMNTMKYAIANSANIINPSYPGTEQTMVMAGRSPGQKTNSYYMKKP